MIYNKKIYLKLKNVSKNVFTKIFIDYNTALKMQNEFGEKYFVSLLNECTVITLDNNTYEHLMTLMNKYKKEDLNECNE